MRTGPVGLTIVLLLLSVAGVFAAEAKKIGDLLPVEISGWKVDGKDGAYDRANLYDYIDGGAEVYLAYGYKEAFARRYAKSGQPGITADVFDMGSAHDAYGIFTFEREGKSVGVGQDSEYAAGFLRFWKGRYFVSILADKETPEVKEAVMALGKAIAERIEEPGERPAMLKLLPEANIVAASTRFFHQKSGLDYHYFVAEKNVLNLGAKTNVVLAQFKTPSRAKAGNVPKAQLALVQYPSAKEAAQACESFRKAMMPGAKGDGAVQAESKKWTLARAKGVYVAVVFEAPDPVYAGALIDAVMNGIEEEAKK